MNDDAQTLDRIFAVCPPLYYFLVSRRDYLSRITVRQDGAVETTDPVLLQRYLTPRRRLRKQQQQQEISRFDEKVTAAYAGRYKNFRLTDRVSLRALRAWIRPTGWLVMDPEKNRLLSGFVHDSRDPIYKTTNETLLLEVFKISVLYQVVTNLFSGPTPRREIHALTEMEPKMVLYDALTDLMRNTQIRRLALLFMRARGFQEMFQVDSGIYDTISDIVVVGLVVILLSRGRQEFSGIQKADLEKYFVVSDEEERAVLDVALDNFVRYCRDPGAIERRFAAQAAARDRHPRQKIQQAVAQARRQDKDQATLWDRVLARLQRPQPVHKQQQQKKLYSCPQEMTVRQMGFPQDRILALQRQGRQEHDLQGRELWTFVGRKLTERPQPQRRYSCQQEKTVRQMGFDQRRIDALERQGRSIGLQGEQLWYHYVLHRLAG